MMVNQIPIIVNSMHTNLYNFQHIAQEWDLDFIQLGEGAFDCDLSQIIYPHYQIGKVRFNSKVKQEGRSPEGFWTFAFVEDANLIWRNFHVKSHSVVVYAPNSEINAVSSSNFKVTLLSIEEKFLLKEFTECGYSHLLSKLNEIEILAPQLSDWNELISLLHLEFELSKTLPIEPSGFDLQKVCEKLTKLCKNVVTNKEILSPVSRLKLLSNAEDYINQNINETIAVTQLAKYCNVSERTLLYAFKQRFGIGSKAYIKILKLNKVYQVLNEINSPTSISSIAKLFGFWHMGQFFADYKSFFGELPSETLNKKL